MGDVHAGWPKEHFYHLHIHSLGASVEICIILGAGGIAAAKR